MAGPDRTDEMSPLVGARPSDDADVESITVLHDPGSDGRRQDAHDIPETKSSWYLFLLTLTIGGYVTSSQRVDILMACLYCTPWQSG